PKCSPDFPALSAQDANIDIRRKPFAERKAMLRKVLRGTGTGIQYVEHTEGDGAEMFEAVCKLGLEGMVSKKLTAPYRSKPSKSWSPMETRASRMCKPHPHDSYNGNANAKRSK